MPKVIKVIYKNGILKLLKPSAQKGREWFVKLETYEDRHWTLRNYREILGKAGKEGIKKLLIEAKIQESVRCILVGNQEDTIY